MLGREAVSRLSARMTDMTPSPVTTVIPLTTSSRTAVDSSGWIFSVPASHLPSPAARDNVTPIKLYFVEGMWGRSNSYIRLSFVNEGRNLGSCALFDTGSYWQYSVSETREVTYTLGLSHFDVR